MSVFVKLLIGVALMPVGYVLGLSLGFIVFLIAESREVPVPPIQPPAPLVQVKPKVTAPPPIIEPPPPTMVRPNICSVLCPEYAPVIKVFDGTTTPTNPVIICCK